MSAETNPDKARVLIMQMSRKYKSTSAVCLANAEILDRAATDFTDAQVLNVVNSIEESERAADEWMHGARGVS